jgi:hypothetical protein
MTRVLAPAVVAVLALGVASRLDAQRGNGQPTANASPRADAPIDLTGYWVSIVTQDWRWRMVTPARGDYLGIPMTNEARKVAGAWDPARDEAAGEQCKSYGAPALMSVPGRLHIAWQDDSTLRVDTDAGMQTRMFRFRGSQAPHAAPRTWQGLSVAEWQVSRSNASNASLLLRPSPRSSGDAGPGQKSGSLRVVTTQLRPGYLRKNGVPYSANAVLTEYWDLYKRPNGEEWLTITTQIEDPLYLSEPRLIALPFKKEPNGARWDPTPCSTRW